MRDILRILNAGLSVVDGKRVISDTLNLSGNELKIQNKIFNLDKYSNIYVLGAGKVAGKMAIGAEKVLGDRISGGLVVVKDPCHAEFLPVRQAGSSVSQEIPKPRLNDHQIGQEVRDDIGGRLKKVKQIVGSHPIPDEKSVRAGKKLLDFASKAKKDNLVIFLLSGGASSLAVAPKGVSLSEKQKLTKLLLECGANIKEINTIRKHLSKIKGGGLAEAIYPATCVTLIISDVLDNDLSVIGSAPTVKDRSTYSEGIHIMQKYGLCGKSQKVFRHFNQQIETKPVKNDKKVFSKMHNMIIADLDTALSAAKAEAEKSGYKIKACDSNMVQVWPYGQTCTISNKVSGIASETGKKYASLTSALKPGECLIGGGETTVIVTGKGKGGRNLELALGFLNDVKDMSGVEFLSINSDGEDGTSGVAGAFVTQKELSEAKKLQLGIDQYLKENNSLAACKKLHCLLKIPRNQTNICDIQILLKTK